jgi:glycerol uptake facilitator-like aquaporin
MNQKWMTTGLVLLMGLGLAGMAWASPDSFANTDSLANKIKEIGGLLLKVVFFGFLIVGGYIVVTSLVDAKKNGGWGHVVVGILMVLVAGIALWTITGMAGQDADLITQSIKVTK